MLGVTKSGKVNNTPVPKGWVGRVGETHLNLTEGEQKDLLQSPTSSEQPAQLAGDLRESNSESYHQDECMNEATNSLADLKLKRMQLLSGNLKMLS